MISVSVWDECANRSIHNYKTSGNSVKSNYNENVKSYLQFVSCSLLL